MQEQKKPALPRNGEMRARVVPSAASLSNCLLVSTLDHPPDVSGVTVLIRDFNCYFPMKLLLFGSVC